jgi:hypothetical protein
MSKKEICVRISGDPSMQGMINFPMLAVKKKEKASDPAPDQQNPQAYQPPDPAAPAWGGGTQPPPWQSQPPPWQSQPPPWQSQPQHWQNQPTPWAYPPNPQYWQNPGNSPAQTTTPSSTSKQGPPEQTATDEWQMKEMMMKMTTLIEQMAELQMQETHMSQDQQELHNMLAYLIQLQVNPKKGPR